MAKTIFATCISIAQTKRQTNITNKKLVHLQSFYIVVNFERVRQKLTEIDLVVLIGGTQSSWFQVNN